MNEELARALAKVFGWGSSGYWRDRVDELIMQVADRIEFVPKADYADLVKTNRTLSKMFADEIIRAATESTK